MPVESLINRTLEPVEDVEESEVLSLLKEVSGAKSEGKYLLLLMFFWAGGGWGCVGATFLFIERDCVRMAWYYIGANMMMRLIV